MQYAVLPLAVAAERSPSATGNPCRLERSATCTLNAAPLLPSGRLASDQSPASTIDPEETGRAVSGSFALSRRNRRAAVACLRSCLTPAVPSCAHACAIKPGHTSTHRLNAGGTSGPAAHAHTVGTYTLLPHVDSILHELCPPVPYFSRTIVLASVLSNSR